MVRQMVPRESAARFIGNEVIIDLVECLERSLAANRQGFSECPP
jgi:hypothetical protein